MSDTEEVVIPRAKREAKVSNTKPEIAREKLKEKRERLKKEKENMIIEEAKKRLASESEKKQQEEWSHPKNSMIENQNHTETVHWDQ